MHNQRSARLWKPGIHSTLYLCITCINFESTMTWTRYFSLFLLSTILFISGCDQIKEPVPVIPYSSTIPVYYQHNASGTHYAINKNGIFACLNDTVKKLFVWENSNHTSIIMQIGTNDTLAFTYVENGPYYITTVGDTVLLSTTTTFLCNGYSNIQDLLNGGTTPITIFQMGINIDSLYGKNYAGGKIAYLDTINGSGMVAAPYDQSTNCYWGCAGTLITGADGDAYGDGFQNTTDILMQCTTIGIAAELCGNLTLGGYSDWHLPSKEELNQVYLHKEAIGGFLPMYYWTSTEFDSMSAWKQYFVNGYQTNYHKETNYKLRAVRYF